MTDTQRAAMIEADRMLVKASGYNGTLAGGEDYRDVHAAIVGLRDALAEPDGWLPISEAHEDYGRCVFIDIKDSYPLLLAKTYTFTFCFRDEFAYQPWTHFLPLRLSTEEAERLKAAMQPAATGGSDGE